MGRSEVGAGTAFYIAIGGSSPAAAGIEQQIQTQQGLGTHLVAEPGRREPETPAGSPGGQMDHQVILLVEDNPDDEALTDSSATKQHHE